MKNIYLEPILMGNGLTGDGTTVNNKSEMLVEILNVSDKKIELKDI